jgi:predicted ATPase/DNA-binding CsgD family transcriptional regulator
MELHTHPIPAHAASAPAYLMRFIGREDESTILAGLLGDERVRWITITGPSGVGKTRLAVEAAQRLLHAQWRLDGFQPYAGPASWFVRFAGITDPSQVPSLIAREIDPATSETDPIEVIRRAADRRRIILILDNVDAVLAAAPALASLLTLPGCERVTLLTTSRTPFHVPGEHLLTITPLPVPDESEQDPALLRANQAVQLFLSCARAARADLVIADDELPVVAGICRRVDGLPLAIELAGRQARRLSLAGIAAQLGKSRFSLDGGPAAPVLPDRLSLRDSIASSYEPLTDVQREFFTRLSVFGGGISLESARRVAAGIQTAGGYPTATGYGNAPPYDYMRDPGLSDAPALRDAGLDLSSLAIDPIDELEQLADFSLIQRTTDAHGETRYEFLETIGEFARDELAARGTVDAARHAHAVIMIYLVDATVEGIWVAPRRVVPIDRLDVELANIRLALDWLLSQGPEWADLSIRLSEVLMVYFQMRGMLPEGLSWLKRALAVNGGSSYRRGTALGTLGFSSWMVGELDQAEAALGESLTVLAGSDLHTPIAKAHFYSALVAWRRGPERVPEMVVHLQEALQHFALWEDGIGAGVCKLALGEVTRLSGQSAAAIQIFTEANEHFTSLGYEWGSATARWFIGEAHRADGNEQSAAESLGAGLRLYRRTGDRLGMSGCLAGIACLVTDRREWVDAARYFGAASTLRERTQSLLPPTHELDHERVAATVLATIGTEDYEKGRALDPAAVIEEALAVADALAAGQDLPGRAVEHPPELTRMQKRVLNLLVDGHEPKEIARRLGRKSSTIYDHLENLRSAFGCDTDLELRKRAEPFVRYGSLAE